MNAARIGVMSRVFWFGAALALCPLVAAAQGTTVLNPVYRRAQTMVNDGSAAAGRALVDSMVAVATPGSNDHAEAVYWRAVLSATAADAEMDYRRIVVDFPLSPRVEDALIRLAQLELARGNYDGALAHLGRLASEHPNSPARPRAGYWTARALFDKNDIQGGCAATTDALSRTTETETELRNQITYLNQRCAGIAIAAPAAAQPITSAPAGPVTAAPVTAAPVTAAPVTPVATPAAPAASIPPSVPARETPVPIVDRPVAVDSVKTSTAKPPARVTPEPVSRPSPSTRGERVYSVQVAAFNVKSQAAAMVAKLSKSGYEARVDGTSAPFRVRIGKYATQAQAGAVQRSLKAKQITGFVVQADIQ